MAFFEYDLENTEIHFVEFKSYVLTEKLLTRLKQFPPGSPMRLKQKYPLMYSGSSESIMESSRDQQRLVYTQSSTVRSCFGKGTRFHMTVDEDFAPCDF